MTQCTYNDCQAYVTGGEHWCRYHRLVIAMLASNDGRGKARWLANVLWHVARSTSRRQLTPGDAFAVALGCR